jgi:hypothetical protein
LTTRSTTAISRSTTFWFRKASAARCCACVDAAMAPPGGSVSLVAPAAAAPRTAWNMSIAPLGCRLFQFHSTMQVSSLRREIPISATISAMVVIVVS